MYLHTLNHILTRLYLLASIIICSCSRTAETKVNLDLQTWIHGSLDCTTNTDVPIQVVQYNENTWILRQNKCINYEAPFMFLFIGDTKALLMDTGATQDEESFPLYRTVQTIIKDWSCQNHKPIQLIVAHTHKHGDHFAADGQFRGKPNATLVGIQKSDVVDFFRFVDWPNNMVDFNLGNRTLKIISIPGHQEASIAVYDSATRILLTGDTVYPGRLYVDDWPAFKSSIHRLVEFSKGHEINYILGNHIEMSTADGVDYPTGTTYQPEERQLALAVEDLQTLQSALNELGDTPTRKVLKKFIIYPK